MPELRDEALASGGPVSCACNQTIQHRRTVQYRRRGSSPIRGDALALVAGCSFATAHRAISQPNGAFGPSRRVSAHGTRLANVDTADEALHLHHAGPVMSISTSTITSDVHHPNLILQGSTQPSQGSTIPKLDLTDRQEQIVERWREALARANFVFRERG